MSFLLGLRRLFGQRGVQEPTAPSRRGGRRPAPRLNRNRVALQVEQLEDRLVMSKITGIDFVLAAGDRNNFIPVPLPAVVPPGTQTSVSVADVEGNINPATIVPAASNQIENTINGKLPGSFHVHSLDLSVPAPSASNAELDAVVNADNSVQFDFLLRGASGDVTVHVPPGLKFWAGVAAGGYGFFQPVVGGVVGVALDDPNYRFTADTDTSFTLGDPNNGLGNGNKDYLFPSATPQVKAFNIQASPTNFMASFANLFVSVPDTSGGNLDPQNVQKLKDEVAKLGQALQFAYGQGFTQVVPKIVGDGTANARLEYVAIKPLPDGMSLTPGGGLSVKSLNANGDQFTVSQNSDGGVQVDADGKTASFAAGAIRTIDLNPGAGKNTEKVQSLPAGVTVNLNLAGDNDVSVTSSRDAVAGTVNVLTPAGVRHGKTTLTVDDSADGSGDRQTTISATSVTVGHTLRDHTSQTQVNYTGGVTSLTVRGGSGARDSFQVDSTSAATPVTISTGGGSSDVFVGALGIDWNPYVTHVRHTLAGIAGAVTVQHLSASGQTTLTVDDSGEAARDLGVTDTRVSFAGVAPITYSGLSGLVLVEGAGRATVTFGGRAPSVPVTLYDTQSKTVAVPPGWQVAPVPGLPSWDPDRTSGVGAASSVWTPPNSGPVEAPWVGQEALLADAEQRFLASAAAGQAFVNTMAQHALVYATTAGSAVQQVAAAGNLAVLGTSFGY